MIIFSHTFAMSRVLLAVAALTAIAADREAGETVIHLHVQPMAAPLPALKYQLLPQVDELVPGNAAQNYLKCFMEQHYFFFSKQAVADRNRFQTMPLLDLPLGQLSGYGGNALRQADWAARMESIDWQTVTSIHSGGMEAPPAELGPIQVLAKAIHVRFRGEIAARKYDDAIRTAQTMLALSRHLGEHPTEVADLVALWVAHLALDSLTEMVQQARCPNLYWALTGLPSPLIDLRKGVQGEEAMVAAELRPIRADGPMTEPELEALVSRLSGIISFAREQSGQPPRSLRAALRALANNPAAVRGARQSLHQSGRKEDESIKFPPLQIVLLDQKHRYEIERDDRLKLLSVPVWQVPCRAATGTPEEARRWPLADLLPNIDKLRAEQAALERQVALLRYVEALRLHAAQHDGKPPAKLADLAVPLPLDPASGRAFSYSVEGTTAHVIGESLPANAQAPGGGVHFTVTMHQ